MARLLFNPDLVLHPDGRRAIVYVRDEVESGISAFVSPVHPRLAVLLALFDGQRTLRDVVSDWAYVGGSGSPDRAGEEFSEFASTWGATPLLVTAESVPPERRKVYDPAAFIVPGQEVDLSAIRCSAPISLVHVTTYRCAVDCAYCYSRPPNAPSDHLSLDRLDVILDEVRDLGVDRASLSGGDVFCHPRGMELIELYAEHGIIPQIATKVPLDDLRARGLRDLGVESIQVSLDSPHAAEHDGLVGRPGHLEALLPGLDAIAKAGLGLRTNTVLTPRNYPGALELIPLLAERYDNLRSMQMTPYGRSLYRHRDDLFLTPDQAADLTDRIKTYQQSYPQVRVHASGMPDPTFYERSPEDKSEKHRERALCSGNRWGFVLLPNGEVTVCEELYHHPRFILGDLRRQTVAEVWNSPEALALAFPAPDSAPAGSACARCPEFVECHHVKGRCYKRALQAYGLDHPDWPDPMCPYAPEGRRF